MKARIFIGCFAFAIGLVSATVRAERVDLTLEVEYAGRQLSAGGTWRLYAATDGQGLSSLDVSVSGVDTAIASELPSGRVNGAPIDNAGFSIFVSTPVGGSVSRIITAQSATVPGAGEQGLFYGFGTLENGSPDFVGRPPGTNTLGPAFTSLTELVNSPWATSGSPSATAGMVASGSFSPGATPGFDAESDLIGFVFSSVGTSTVAGEDVLASEITTNVLTNLELGVGDGDYNLDGVVNAADYAVWRDTLGEMVASLTGADGDGDGIITQADYDIWVANFGASSGAAAVAVPEPAAGIAAGLLVTAVLARRTEKAEQSRAVA